MRILPEWYQSDFIIFDNYDGGLIIASIQTSTNDKKYRKVNPNEHRGVIPA